MNATSGFLAVSVSKGKLQIPVRGCYAGRTLLVQTPKGTKR